MINNNKITVFVGGPIQYAIDPDGVFNNNLKQLIGQVIKNVRHMGYNVFSAHLYENFGELDVSEKYSEVCQRDFEWMKNCDIFIAILPLNEHGTIIHSSGTAIELGWASVLKKPIIILRDQAPVYSHLVAGLKSVANVNELFINSKYLFQNLEDCLLNITTTTNI